MSKDNTRLLDYAHGIYLEFPVADVRLKLYETIARLEEKHDEFLDSVKASLKDVDEAVVLMASLTSGVILTGKEAIAQDNLKRAADCSERMDRLLRIANNYTGLAGSGVNYWIRLTEDQAREFGL